MVEAAVKAAVKAADPVAARDREEAEAQRQLAQPTGSTEDGLRGFYIRGPFATIAKPDAAVAYFAQVLLDLGDTDSLDVRRVKAVLILANPVHAVDLLRAYQQWLDTQTDPRPQIDWSEFMPAVVLYVHLYGGDDSEGVARVEDNGPVTEAWVREHLGPHARFTIRPVHDIEGQAPVDAHEIPDRHRQAVHLMTPADTFPFSTSTSRSQQIDHTVTFEHGAAARGAGQSRVGNYGKLTVHHHRIKTFAGWQVHQPFSGPPATSSTTPAPAESTPTRKPPDRLARVTEGPATPRIVAVVVTFNRLALLQRLVARLRETEGLAEVLVVDNASTDGTGEWLATQPAPVRALTLPDNRGGAGGFHVGLASAMDAGADLAWLMDDDGIPEPDCLKVLLDHDEYDFWGPAVLAEQDPSRLCFPIRLPGRAAVVHRMAEVELAARDGVIEDVVIPFNGVLVTRDLVERIGTVREDFFIWGDDVEYLWRARRAGARTGTVVAARFLHPATDDLGTPMAFGRTTYNHSPSDLKHYCMARNNLVNLRDYRGWPAALAFVAKTAWFYAFTRPSPGRLLLSARAMLAGVRGDFTGHRRYLR